MDRGRFRRDRRRVVCPATPVAISNWDKGDVDAAFAGADLILEEVIVHQSVTHHPMEPRTNMAYWENGKLYAHVSTQSAQRTKAAVAGAVGIDQEDVVLIAEYCGGGFGSKIAGTTVMQIPAIFSRKINRPVMLRITRYEENYVGRARPGFQAWVKMGFRNDGKCIGVDLFIVEEGGAYGSGDNGTAGAIADLIYTPSEHALPRCVDVYEHSAQGCTEGSGWGADRLHARADLGQGRPGARR